MLENRDVQLGNTTGPFVNAEYVLDVQNVELNDNLVIKKGCLYNEQGEISTCRVISTIVGTSAAIACTVAVGYYCYNVTQKNMYQKSDNIQNNIVSNENTLNEKPHFTENFKKDNNLYNNPLPHIEKNNGQKKKNISGMKTTETMTLQIGTRPSATHSTATRPTMVVFGKTNNPDNRTVQSQIVFLNSKITKEVQEAIEKAFIDKGYLFNKLSIKKNEKCVDLKQKQHQGSVKKKVQGLKCCLVCGIFVVYILVVLCVFSLTLWKGEKMSSFCAIMCGVVALFGVVLGIILPIDLIVQFNRERCLVFQYN